MKTYQISIETVNPCIHTAFVAACKEASNEHWDADDQSRPSKIEAKIIQQVYEYDCMNREYLYCFSFEIVCK